MALTQFITHRRMETSADRTHVHVGWVKLMDGTVLSRAQVFAAIGGGAAFKTHAPNGSQANVIRIRCARCRQDYLRTDRDKTKTDNLDELPTF